MGTIIILVMNFAFAGFSTQVDKYSEMYHVDKKIINRIIEVESSGRENVYSEGCVGLMQVKHDTATLMDFSGSILELYKPENNIKYGTKYIRYLMILFDGDMNKVLAAYNKGPGYVERHPSTDWSKDKYVKKILKE